MFQTISLVYKGLGVLKIFWGFSFVFRGFTGIQVFYMIFQQMSTNNLKKPCVLKLVWLELKQKHEKTERISSLVNNTIVVFI